MRRYLGEADMGSLFSGVALVASVFAFAVLLAVIAITAAYWINPQFRDLIRSDFWMQRGYKHMGHETLRAHDSGVS